MDDGGKFRFQQTDSNRKVNQPSTTLHTYTPIPNTLIMYGITRSLRLNAAASPLRQAAVCHALEKNVVSATDRSQRTTSPLLNSKRFNSGSKVNGPVVG